MTGDVASRLVVFFFASIGFVSGAVSQNYYSEADAQYVTTSRNPEVLQYVICLEGAVGQRPRNESLSDSLSVAERACGSFAARLPNIRNEPTAADIRGMIEECGFRPGDASPDAACGVAAAAPAVAPSRGVVADEVSIAATAIELGKWLEGISYDGTWLWVTESGQRTIAKVDIATRKVVKRFKVGRLPIAIIPAGGSDVFTLVSTDKVILRQSSSGRKSTLAKLADCPQAMTAWGNDLYVLTLPACSSDSSRLIRVDTRNGSQTNSADLGEWGQTLVAVGSEVWVGHARGTAIDVVDQSTLRASELQVSGTEVWAMAANSTDVFAGGRQTGTDHDGRVVMIDVRTRSEIARQSVSEMVAQIVADATYVVVVGGKGTIWVFSAGDLSLLRTIHLNAGDISARGAIFVGDSLLISVSTFIGENGAVFVLSNYLPPAPAVRRSAPPAATPRTAPPQAAAPRPVQPNRNTGGFPVSAGSWGGVIRSGPGMSFAQLGSTAEGDPLTLLEEAGHQMNSYPWFRVRYGNGQIGYQWGGIICAVQTPISGTFGLCSPNSQAAAQFNQSAPTNRPRTSASGAASSRNFGADGQQDNGASGGRRLDPRSLAAVGTFARQPAQSGWDTGNIERDGNALRWTNFAGVSWRLTPDMDNQRLLTGTDNPFFKNGFKEFALVFADGDVNSFWFHNEQYFRTATVLPMVTPPGQTQPGGTEGEPPDQPVTVDDNGNTVTQFSINVVPGAGPVTAANGIARGSRDEYRFFANSGQTLTVSASAAADNVAFDIHVGSPGGSSLTGGGDNRFWTGVLTEDTEYFVVVGAMFGGTSYNLDVSLDEAVALPGVADEGPNMAPAPGVDPRSTKDYSALPMGYFSTCAADFGEGSAGYYDCLDDGLVREANTNSAAGRSALNERLRRASDGLFLDLRRRLWRGEFRLLRLPGRRAGAGGEHECAAGRSALNERLQRASDGLFLDLRRRLWRRKCWVLRLPGRRAGARSQHECAAGFAGRKLRHGSCPRRPRGHRRRERRGRAVLRGQLRE